MKWLTSSCWFEAFASGWMHNKWGWEWIRWRRWWPSVWRLTAMDHTVITLSMHTWMTWEGLKMTTFPFSSMMNLDSSWKNCRITIANGNIVCKKINTALGTLLRTWNFSFCSDFSNLMCCKNTHISKFWFGRSAQDYVDRERLHGHLPHLIWTFLSDCFKRPTQRKFSIFLKFPGGAPRFLISTFILIGSGVSLFACKIGDTSCKMRPAKRKSHENSSFLNRIG